MPGRGYIVIMMRLKNIFRGFHSFLGKLLDVILPRRARRVRAEALFPEDLSISAAVLAMEGVKITALLDYKEKKVEDVIRSLKYDGSVRAAGLCAQALADFLREELSEARAFSSREILLIPVPLHKSRERERGFNQIALVLRLLPKEFRDGSLCALAPSALARIRATQQQTRLPREERIKNVEGAFEVMDEDIVRNTHVFLIDDVVTTGATLANAARPLLRSAAEVTLIALARA